MNGFARTALAAGLALAALGAANAQTIDTRTLAPGAAPGKASLDALKGIAGLWTNKTGAAGFSAPFAGEIVGHVYQTDDKGLPRVQELWIFKAEGGSLTLRQKIINGDFSEREDKDKYEVRKLIAVEGDKLYFETMTITPKGDVLDLQVNRSVGGPIDQVYYRAK